MHRIAPSWIVLLISLMLPAAAAAQGALARGALTGTVRDASGAVLPGVTVEASSPALIEKTRSVVTDCLGLTTLLMAGLSAVSVTDRALSDATGRGAPVLIVLGSLLLGGIAGSLLRIGDRLDRVARHNQGPGAQAVDVGERLVERFLCVLGGIGCIGRWKGESQRPVEIAQPQAQVVGRGGRPGARRLHQLLDRRCGEPATALVHGVGVRSQCRRQREGRHDGGVGRSQRHDYRVRVAGAPLT